jgi:hypothetical protein
MGLVCGPQLDQSVERLDYGLHDSIPGWGNISSVLQTVQIESGTQSDLYSTKKEPFFRQ